jgi:hypothetical protein
VVAVHGPEAAVIRHQRESSLVTRLLLGITAVMVVLVIIQAVAMAVGWGLLALVFAVWVTRGVWRGR